ncbi:MAG: ATP-binding cassette domain-containing protein [Actinomycetota bacterium]|nr:ATP-binding cassette domain-containing protein [Actinomycetota bacterium]
MAAPALELQDVGLVRDDVTILRAVTWTVAPGEHWVVLGRNGSGKTSLVRIASMYLHPSTGTVRLLGEELGRTDVRRLRRRVGLSSPALANLLRPELTGVEVVMTGRNAALEPWWHEYTAADRASARALLERFDVGHGADRAMATLSSGERQRVLLARAYVGEPGLVLLDEPTAGLDLGGREELVAALARAAADPATPPTVLVTHHVEEIPEGATHVLLLEGGRILAAGPLDDTLGAGVLSEAFGVTLRVERREGRWSAWAARR